VRRLPQSVGLPGADHARLRASARVAIATGALNRSPASNPERPRPIPGQGAPHRLCGDICPRTCPERHWRPRGLEAYSPGSAKTRLTPHCRFAPGPACPTSSRRGLRRSSGVVVQSSGAANQIGRRVEDPPQATGLPHLELSGAAKIPGRSSTRLPAIGSLHSEGRQRVDLNRPAGRYPGGDERHQRH